MEYHSTSIHMVIGLLYIGALATSFMPISILILSGLSLPWGPSQHYRAESIGRVWLSQMNLPCHF